MIYIRVLQGKDISNVYYLVADRLLISGFSFASLSAFQTNGSFGQKFSEKSDPIVFSLPDQATTIFCGSGWVGGQWRKTSIRKINNGYWINVANIGDFYVTEDGSSIYISSHLSINDEWLAETVLGPALTLALALQGTFCLHASAVAIGRQVIAFIGESGYGKSTLSAYLDSEVGSDWQFVADDVLPVCIDRQRVVCLPHFPQLKLPADHQWGTGNSRKRPLTAVYRINPPDPDNDSIRINPLTTLEATLTLGRHTVAAKLFDAQLLSKHLDFAATVARQVTLKQLVYPRDYEKLPAVSAALAADFAV